MMCSKVGDDVLHIRVSLCVYLRQQCWHSDYTTSQPIPQTVFLIQVLQKVSVKACFAFLLPSAMKCQTHQSNVKDHVLNRLHSHPAQEAYWFVSTRAVELLYGKKQVMIHTAMRRVFIFLYLLLIRGWVAGAEVESRDAYSSNSFRRIPGQSNDIVVPASKGHPIQMPEPPQLAPPDMCGSSEQGASCIRHLVLSVMT